MESKKYVVAIPSYNRFELIQKYALTFLDAHDIYLDANIYVFADPRSYDKYQELEREYTWLRVVRGKQGLCNQRNCIRDYFNNGQKIMYLDDDLRGLRQCKDFTKAINDEILDTFALMDNHNVTLCGVHPTNNTYYASGKNQYGFYFAVGCFYLEINIKHPLLYDYMKSGTAYNSECEDFIRTFQHFKYCGQIMRNDNLAVIHKYNHAKGGMNTSDARLMHRHMFSLWLVDQYPAYFRIKDKKHGKRMIKEARLRTPVMYNMLYKVSKTDTGNMPGHYYQAVDGWTVADQSRNIRLFDEHNDLIAIILRDVLDVEKFDNELMRKISQWTKYNNTNRGDIAGILDESKIARNHMTSLENKGLDLTTCKKNSKNTRVAESGFQFSNITHCITLGEYAKGRYSQYDKELNDTQLGVKLFEILDQMQNIYNTQYASTQWGDGLPLEYGLCKSIFKSVTINKSLRSANHRDGRNASKFALCFSMDDPYEQNISTGGDLLFPEYRFKCNLRRNKDVVLFASKDIYHCNESITATDHGAKYNSRMSWVFFSK